MASPKKAVAVAEDVLVQLRKRKNTIIPHQGTYLETDAEFTDEQLDGHDLQEYVDKVQKADCKVCAVGAAVMSKARLFDNVPADVVVVADDIHGHLFDVFDENTVALMECAFEQSDSFSTGQSEKHLEAAIEFGERYEDDKERLRAIMKNIIENNGKFKPWAKAKVEK